MSKGDEPAGWHGFFRPLRHYVPNGARQLRLADGAVTFAFCDSACVPPSESTAELPWCPACRRHLDWMWP